MLEKRSRWSELYFLCIPFDMAFTKLFSSVNLWRISYSTISKRYCSAVSEDSPTCGKKSDEARQSSNDQPENKKGLVLGVYEEGEKFELTPVAEEINQKSGGKICKHLNEMSCHLKHGKAFVVTDILEEFGPVAIASLGKKNPGYNELEMLDETRENLRVGVGVGVRELVKRGCDHVYVDGGTEPDAAAEAAHLAAWRFEEFKSSGAKSFQTDVFLQGSGEELWKRGTIFGSGQNWARYLTDMPPNKMTPVDFAQAVLDMLCPLGVHVTAHDPAWIEAQRMEALLSVSRGSCEPAVFLECEYRAGGDRPPVLLAAKGITFDSGGLCLKKADEMRENPDSRAGAAATVGALKILAEMKVPINVVAVIPLCESMVSGSCMKVGDVLRALNGLTMQVECTAQAGRLTLADALVYGQAKHRPSLVIDLASLTRGVQLATGSAAFGVFSSSGEAWAALAQSAARAGDRGWRLPLWSYYRSMIDDDPSVDLRNRGPGTAAPCVGAAFLKNFVCAPWLHLDVSGVSRGGTPYLPAPRAAGRPARTLAEFLTAAGTASANVKDSDSPATS
ncbi:cytosol aminopeptidase-like isoform X1 [Danaus plexippus]|uniref:cytosol aminopeptidase-like isoform X1 n=1 Tax=Danaus plexippus TaxID=13037 RepID=UPI002AB1461F|nr:cytosol aminopeptidase-like isoform X1 [Danaus plexippus]